MLFGVTRFSEKASRIRSLNASRSIPLRQPIPTAAHWGISLKSRFFPMPSFPESEQVIQMLRRQIRSGCSPFGTAPEMGKSLKNPTGSPARISAEISFAAFISSIISPFSAANRSTANFRFRSVAVVITGHAPRISAAVFASALAPPKCPERSGTANRPVSSIETTAGSVRLSRINGAMERTAIPQAPIKTIPSASWNCSPVQEESVPFKTGLSRLPASLSAS